jgi:signal transduction histidine kinase
VLNPDASILGQILTAQNILFVLPSTKTIAEFYASALASLPGVRWSRVCLGDASAHAGPFASELCAGCPGQGGSTDRSPAATCQLASAAHTCVLAADTIDKRYGYFIIGIDQIEIFEPYRGFIGNLAGFVALHLENREKSAWLRRNRDELEATLRRLEEQLRQTQRLESVGQLAGGVAHDFNNILASMVMGISALRKEPGLGPEMCEGLDDLRGDTERAAALTRQLLFFSRGQAADFKPLDLNLVIADMAKMLRRLISETIELVIQVGDADACVKADASMMEQILLNLCVNARDAMPCGGSLVITTGRALIDAGHALLHGVRPGTFVSVSVKDTGCGMVPATLQRIFEPFFTTKEVGKGTGLGLPTVYGIVKQHQGWIEVESTPGQGSIFRVFLPGLEAGTAE